MRRFCFALLALTMALSMAAWAANIKLYMKDGSYHLVREYKVETDRVRFYSIERSDWEEMPLELLDLKRTEAEAAERKAELDRDAKMLSDEEKIQRDMEKEVSRIPQDPGVYWLDGKQTKVIKAAEATLKTNKGRSVLAKLSPVPMVSGKATLEVDGLHSKNVITNPEQEFYFQLSETERFGIAKLAPKGAVRIVENVTIVPISKEMVEELNMVPSFQKQLADGLYKVWPREPLEAGEYALVEYTEGKMNVQIFDFSVQKGK